MTNHSTPETAEGWVELLAKKSLPATPAVGKHVLHLLRTGTPSYAVLAELIARDPVLSYHVMAHVRSVMGGKIRHGAQPSQSIEQAISMIGVGQLSHVVSKVTYFKPDPTNIRHFYYLRSLNTSLLAAFLAREMARGKSQFNGSALFWSALYQGTPNWYLWRFATPEMRLIRYAIRDGKKNAVQVEREVLGVPISEITHHLTSELAMPELAKNSLRKKSEVTAELIEPLAALAVAEGVPDDPGDRTLMHRMHEPEFIIILSNLLAESASWDWYSESTLQLQKVLSVVLRVPLVKAVSLSHRAAVEMSHSYAYPGVLSPAAKLFLPSRNYIETNSFDESELQALLDASGKAAAIQMTTDASAAPKEMTAPPPDKPRSQGVEANLPTAAEFNRVKKRVQDVSQDASPADSAPPLVHPQPVASDTEVPERKRNKPLLTAMLAKLTHDAERFTDLHEIMNAAAQTIGYGLGLSRCCIALVNKDVTRLKAYYSVGLTDAPDFARYQLDLTKPSLFSRLAEAPAGIWVKPDSTKKTWALIPIEFKKLSGAREFFLMSVFLNKRPVAIFYCDAGKEAEPLTEWEYQKFKQVCNAVAACLKAHSDARKKHRPVEEAE